MRSRFDEAAPEDCWPWKGRPRDNGYGAVSIGSRRDGSQRTLYAHVAVWLVLMGDFPEGNEVDHLCRNRICVNPNHLEPVSSRTNTLRAPSLAAANVAKTECPRGHPYDDANTYERHGKRHCRACVNVRRSENREHHRAVTREYQRRRRAANRPSTPPAS